MTECHSDCKCVQYLLRTCTLWATHLRSHMFMLIKLCMGKQRVPVHVSQGRQPCSITGTFYSQNLCLTYACSFAHTF